MNIFIRRGVQTLLILFSSLLLFFTLPITTTQADNSVWFYDPYPQGKIGISMPEIGWKIYLGDNQLEKAEFIINGTAYTPSYDRNQSIFYIRPEQGLSGNVEVKARIKLKNWWNWIEKSWSFQVDSVTLNSLPYPNSQQQKAINYANDYRYILQLPLFKLNPALNMAAQKHAAYQARAGLLTHYEESQNPGYFGRTVQERANYFGFFGSVAEDISYNSNPSIQRAVDDLFDAPYHRIPFLNPSLTKFGYGESSTYSVLNFGSVTEPNETMWVAYPGDGHENVPIDWINYETPNPLRFYTNVSKRVGYPIMVGVYGRNIEAISLVGATLRDKNYNKVPLYINAPKGAGNQDDHLQQEIILIPKSPLAYSSNYSAEVTIEIIDKDGNRKNINKTWSFSTINKSEDSKLKLHQQFNYPEFQETAKQLQLFLGQRYIWLDQDAYPLDIAPFIRNNRTMIPFRAIGNILGAEVKWDGTTQTVQYIKENRMIEIPINSKVVYINKKKVVIDQPAIIENSRSFVPIRFVTEQLGAKVEWQPQTQAVLIELP